MEEVSASFDRFCLAAGIEALGEMMEKDAAEACGPSRQSFLSATGSIPVAPWKRARKADVATPITMYLLWVAFDVAMLTAVSSAHKARFGMMIIPDWNEVGAGAPPS
jgi:hypothetical protein